MTTLITKANADYWYRFKDINTLEELMRIYPRVIVEKNYFTESDVEFWEGFKQEDIPKLREAKYHVTIYNGYVE